MQKMHKMQKMQKFGRLIISRHDAWLNVVVRNDFLDRNAHTPHGGVLLRAILVFPIMRAEIVKQSWV